MWTWVSIPPGIRVRPRRSQVGVSRGFVSLPGLISTIRPPSTTRVTSLRAPPLPSRSLPTRIVTGPSPRAGSASSRRRASAGRSGLIVLRKMPQRLLQARQGGVDVGQRDRAGAEAEPPVVLGRAEGLEGDGADAGRLQQPVANLVVGAQLAAAGAAAEGMDAGGEIDRPHRRDAVHRQSPPLDRLEAGVQPVEARLELALEDDLEL